MERGGRGGRGEREHLLIVIRGDEACELKLHDVCVLQLVLAVRHGAFTREIWLFHTRDTTP